MRKACWLIPLFVVFLLVFVGVWWFFPSPISGGLKWESRNLSYQVKTGEEKVAEAFSFKNVSSKAVTIKSVVPDCSCVTSSFVSRSFAPGESGKIPVTFVVGSRYGKVKKNLLVLTDASSQPTMLELSFDIPVLLDVAPRLLFWKKGEANEVKKIRISIPDHPYQILRVDAVNRAFQTELKTLTPDREFEISVKPTDTKTARSSELIIQTNCPYASWNYIVCELRME